MRLQNLIGERFSRLLVLSKADNRNNLVCWNCVCDCGKFKIVRAFALKSGNTKSCGCLAREVCIARNTTHNDFGSKEYRSWAGMITRCTNKTLPGYRNYGGRGVRVCDRWRYSYQSFITDMGRAPSSFHSIDRIDNDGNYEPSNCKWSTRTEQNNNTTRSIIIEYNGKRQTLTQWSRDLEIHKNTLNYRFKNGMPLNKVFSKSPLITQNI